MATPQYLLPSVAHAMLGENGARPGAPGPFGILIFLIFIYSGSLTQYQPRVLSWTARTRKGPAASDSWAMTRTIWR